MAATSISRRICQRSVVITFEVKRNSGLLTIPFHMNGLYIYKKESRQTVIAHKFVGSASLRLAL